MKSPYLFINKIINFFKRSKEEDNNIDNTKEIISSVGETSNLSKNNQNIKRRASQN